MEAVQYKIITLLHQLSERFPQMTFTYGYDSSIPQHIVEVQPHELYESDEYMVAESDAVCEFIESYPTEGLLFTSNNPFIEVKEPLFFVGRKCIVVLQLSIEALNEPIAVDSYLINPTIPASELLGSLYTTNSIAHATGAVFGKKAVDVGGHTTVGGEYHYAMAA